MIFLLGVINIKSKLLIIVMAVVLFVNSYDLTVFANTDYDHNELLDYAGYGEAMYETIVEQTTFISGRYTENKDYVNETINQITDYGKGWWDEYMRISNMPPKEKLREMINASGGYLLTVGDFIKNLFNDANESEVIAPPPQYNGVIITDVNSHFFRVPKGYYMQFSHKTGVNKVTTSGALLAFKGNTVALDVAGEITPYKPFTSTDSAIFNSLYNNFKASDNVSHFLTLLSYFNVSVTVKMEGEQPKPINANFDRLNRYIQNTSPKIVTPQPKAYLSCPDGTRINMSINGSTFLDINGQVMQVSKDGTATVNSQLCNLGWEKPKVEYIPGTDQVGITTPDGNTIDAETGESISGEFDDELEDGCGTLCAIGKMLKGLGTIAAAIASIPLKILDGLFELIKKIVVPPENYLTEQMDTIKEEFFNEEIEEGIQSIEELSNAGGGTFESVQVSIMGVDNVMVVDSSSVNKSLDTIHSWIRGIFYPLLLFFNINMLYRLIRGTSLVGIGHFGNKGGGKE